MRQTVAGLVANGRGSSPTARLTLREVQNIGLNTPYDKSGTSVMRLNPLGATDVIVSRLGLGMAALGRPGYINLGHGEDLGAARDVPSIEANARRVLDAACAAGIRYFDAARSCGRGEAFLGRWQEERAIPPSAVTVSRSDWREAVPVVVASESPRWALAAIPGVTLHRQSA